MNFMAGDGARFVAFLAHLPDREKYSFAGAKSCG
jgi:hypothetical protein